MPEVVGFRLLGFAITAFQEDDPGEDSDRATPTGKSVMFVRPLFVLMSCARAVSVPLLVAVLLRFESPVVQGCW